MRKLIFKHCKKSKNDAMANFLVKGNKEYIITISEKHTKEILDYFHTIVHELLHFAFTLTRIKYKIQINEKKEHKLIDKMEKSITDIFIKSHFKKGK